MSDKSDIHAVPHGEKWAAKAEGNSRATRVFDTQAEAVKYAREVAKNNEVELFIHGKNGQIRERNSYGNDPHPPKG